MNISRASKSAVTGQGIDWVGVAGGRMVFMTKKWFLRYWVNEFENKHEARRTALDASGCASALLHMFEMANRMHRRTS